MSKITAEMASAEIYTRFGERVEILRRASNSEAAELWQGSDMPDPPPYVWVRYEDCEESICAIGMLRARGGLAEINRELATREGA